MIRQLLEAIQSKDMESARILFDQIIREKVQIQVESLKSKMVVRQGKIRRKWTEAGGAKIKIRGKEYELRRAEVDPKTGKKKEVQRTEKEIRAKIIKMKRKWRTQLRSKLPQILRNRLRSMKIAKHLENNK